MTWTERGNFRYVKNEGFFVIFFLQSARKIEKYDGVCCNKNLRLKPFDFRPGWEVSPTELGRIPIPWVHTTGSVEWKCLE